MEQRIVTKTSFYTNIMLLSIPIILQQFLESGSVDLCDSIMLGRIDQGPDGCGFPRRSRSFSCSTLSANGFAIGCSVLIAQYWGLPEKRRDQDSVRHRLKDHRGLRDHHIRHSPDPPGSGHEDLQQRSGSDRTGSFLFKDRGVDVHPMRGEFNVVRMLQGNRADEDLLRGKCGILSDQSDPDYCMIFGKLVFRSWGSRAAQSEP